jgi:hypothetical protein
VPFAAEDDEITGVIALAQRPGRRGAGQTGPDYHDPLRFSHFLTPSGDCNDSLMRR